MKIIVPFSALIASVAIVQVCSTAVAQSPRRYTESDYANAERFMAYNLSPLAWKGQVSAQWLDDDRFWYREVDDSGSTAG